MQTGTEVGRILGWGLATWLHSGEGRIYNILARITTRKTTIQRSMTKYATQLDVTFPSDLRFPTTQLCDVPWCLKPQHLSVVLCAKASYRRLQYDQRECS